MESNHPYCSVRPLALEVLQALVRRGVGLCGESDAWNEPAGHIVALCGLDRPLVAALVEPRALDGAVEINVLLEVELVLEVLKVASQLLPVRVALFE